MVKDINLKGRDARLATVGNPNIRKNKKSSIMADDATHEATVGIAGRKGYAEKAKSLGCFLPITILIQKFRAENPDSSYLDLWEVLHNTYPYIFTQSREQVYSGNVSKMINNEPAWQEAYFVGKDNLIEMAEYRLGRLLRDDSVEDATVIRAYDVLKKYEAAKNTEQSAISEETETTLLNIQIGLQEMGTIK